MSPIKQKQQMFNAVMRSAVRTALRAARSDAWFPGFRTQMLLSISRI